MARLAFTGKLKNTWNQFKCFLNDLKTRFKRIKFGILGHFDAGVSSYCDLRLQVKRVGIPRRSRGYQPIVTLGPSACRSLSAYCDLMLPVKEWASPGAAGFMLIKYFYLC